jgi:hypothetical protein
MSLIVYFLRHGEATASQKGGYCGTLDPDLTLLGIDVGRFRDRLEMPVAAISIVEMAVNGPLLHRMGDRAHLREPLRQREGT